MTGSPSLDTLLHRLGQFPENSALVWKGQHHSYKWLLATIDSWETWLRDQAVKPGHVVLLRGDYSPNTISLMLALAKLGAITIPYAQHAPSRYRQFLEISQAQFEVQVDSTDHVRICRKSEKAEHPLYEQLREAARPGLVLFSSGTTGTSKALLHDLDRLLTKCTRMQPRQLRVLAFLFFDHMGGIDTLLYTLASAGCLVIPDNNRPDDILKAVEEAHVQVLPTTPTFLALLLLSGATQRHDLTRLEKITYGAEPMPEVVLQRLSQMLPHVKFTQTYGLSEVGVLRSRSQASDSLWMQVGGDEYETRVVNGILQIRSPHLMLGCLNDTATFTEDGWFVTGDLVRQQGDMLRIVGRQSDVINVGGEKVLPSEVENVILELREILSADVYGEPNPITGQIVCAQVILADQDQEQGIVQRIRLHCLKRLPKAQVPVKISITYSAPYDPRFKKRRIRPDRLT